MHGRTIHWVKAKNSRQACVFRSTANVGFGSRPCENSNARRARRNILEKLRVLRTDNAADIRLDAMSENCVSIFPRCMSFHTAWVKTGHWGNVHHECFTPISGHRPTRRACPLRAIRRHSHLQQIAAYRSRPFLEIADRRGRGRARPDCQARQFYGQAGVGSANHLTSELYRSLAGFERQ